MIKSPLTDATIRTLPIPATRREIPDAGARGLYLIVQPVTGAKSWAVRFSRDGKVKKLTLGRYPDMRLADARKRATAAAVAVDDGRDPIADRAAQRETRAAARTVRDLANDFTARHFADAPGARWAAEARRILDKDILPAIGDKAVGAIGKPEIHAVLDAIVDRGSPIAANRALAVMRKLFAWAVSRGELALNPAAGIAKPGAEAKRDRVLADVELAWVWRAADAMPYPFGAAVKLLILTAARREEVGAMTWAEVDLAGKVWTLPPERAKNSVEHIIPLSDAAVAILKSLPRVGKRGGFVFTMTGETPVSGWSRAKANLDAAILKAARKDDPKASPIPGWRLHDLRRTAATGFAALGVAMPVVEKVLNHVSGSFGGVAGVYQRFQFADEKRSALDAWAVHVHRIVEK